MLKDIDLPRQVEVVASCLVEALIIAVTKPKHQGQQFLLVWEKLATSAATQRLWRCANIVRRLETGRTKMTNGQGEKVEGGEQEKECGSFSDV